MDPPNLILQTHCAKIILNIRCICSKRDRLRFYAEIKIIFGTMLTAISHISAETSVLPIIRYKKRIYQKNSEHLVTVRTLTLKTVTVFLNPIVSPESCRLRISPLQTVYLHTFHLLESPHVFGDSSVQYSPALPIYLQMYPQYLHIPKLQLILYIPHHEPCCQGWRKILHNYSNRDGKQGVRSKFGF